MQIFRAFLATILVCTSLSSCNRNTEVISDWEKHMEEYGEWQEQRLERLKSGSGWLNLAGLFWLDKGLNTLGSDSAMQVVLPAGLPGNAGALVLSDSGIRYMPSDAEILADSMPAGEMAVRHDQQSDRTIFSFRNFEWYVIRRGERYGIRLRDLEHPRLNELDHIPSYPFDRSWVIGADYIPYDSAITIEVPTVIRNYVEFYKVPGELHFSRGRDTHILLPFKGSKGFFLVFGDETNGFTTYGGGRFLYTGPPEDGKVLIDFNRAYNPPCAFSPFATCPLPPMENMLNLSIRAGEKSVHLD